MKVGPHKFIGKMMKFYCKTLILLNLFIGLLFLGGAQALDGDSTEQNPSTHYRLVKAAGPDPWMPVLSRWSFYGQEGWVDLRFTVAPDGQIEAVEVVKAEPRQVFERSALGAASQWVFEAPSDAGVTETISGIYRVNFITD